jgi:coenzyme F420-reducing hydrogenase delta subunit
MITELLDDFGHDPRRIKLAWVSSAEPDKFVEAVTEMTERVKKLGPVNGEPAKVASGE